MKNLEKFVSSGGKSTSECHQRARKWTPANALAGLSKFSSPTHFNDEELLCQDQKAVKHIFVTLTSKIRQKILRSNRCGLRVL